MAGFLAELGIGRPVVQAGMGGGLSGAALAAAVSKAGGLGTIGFLAPAALSRELEQARALTSAPVAVNLLLPFARRAHFEAASEADVVVTFWGRPRRRSGKPWIHQAGSVEEAIAAHSAGADAVIAQGREAGGHVRGTVPARELLARVRDSLPDGYPVLSAGGIADAADVAERLGEGADGVVCGTRFLMSDESGAHPAYKARLLEADETVVTQLFGLGWPGLHRVVPNAATERWAAGDGRGPSWLRLAQSATAPLLSRLPMSLQGRLAEAQTAARPLFGPVAATAGGPGGLVDAGPLYAGETVARIADVRPAADLVRELARGIP